MVFSVPRNLKLVSREDKPLRHVAMVAKVWDLYKPWFCKCGRNKRQEWHVQLGTNKPVAHTILSLLDNANGRLCQEKLLRSIDFVTMVTGRQTSPFKRATLKNRRFTLIRS